MTFSPSLLGCYSLQQTACNSPPRAGHTSHLSHEALDAVGEPSRRRDRYPTPIWGCFSGRPIHEFQLFHPVLDRLLRLLKAEQLVYGASECRQLPPGHCHKASVGLNATLCCCCPINPDCFCVAHVGLPLVAILLQNHRMQIYPKRRESALRKRSTTEESPRNPREYKRGQIPPREKQSSSHLPYVLQDRSASDACERQCPPVVQPRR